MPDLVKCVPSPWTNKGQTYPSIVVCPKDRKPYYKDGKRCMKCDRLVAKRKVKEA